MRFLDGPKIYLADVLAFSTVDISFANASVALLAALVVSSLEVVSSYSSGSTPYSTKLKSVTQGDATGRTAFQNAASRLL